jgi:tight adherence protein B
MTAVSWLLLSAAALLVGGGPAWRLKPLSARGRAAPPPSSWFEPVWAAVQLRAAAAAARVARGTAPPRATVAALLAACFCAGLLAGPLGVTAVAVLTVLAVALNDALSGRHRSALRHQAAEAVGLVAAELSAGTPLAEAVRAAADVAPEHGRELTALAESADAAMAVRSDEYAIAAVGHALRVSYACGAALSDVLERVAADLAARADCRRDAKASLAGPRASCVLLAGLPLLGLALGTAMGAHPAHYLLAEPSGRWVACAGTVLDVVGVLWVRAVLRRALPP